MDNVYVTLPPHLIATWYPGYFWHTQDQALYSLKVGGVLQPIKMERPNKFNKLGEPGYRVSVRGQRRFMAYGRLAKLNRELKQLELFKTRIM